MEIEKQVLRGIFWAFLIVVGFMAFAICQGVVFKWCEELGIDYWASFFGAHGRS